MNHLAQGRALITGATAGIGAEFARQLAASGHDLVLVARDTARLEAFSAELTTAHRVRAEVLTADLLTAEGLAAVEERLASTENPVEVLINNAGFGLRSQFEESSVEEEQSVIDLLVAAPMRLTHAALRQMLPRRQGTIVNVASVAGYTPRGTYGAAKAWVLSFSTWANIYYRRQGVSVTAVAPGFVHTEFHARMGVAETGIPAFMWLDADFLVRVALKDIAKGKAVSVPSARYKLIVWLSGWLPKKVVAANAPRAR